VTILHESSALTQELMHTAVAMGQMAVEVHGAPATRLQALPLCELDPALGLWLGVLPPRSGLAAPRICDAEGAILVRSELTGHEQRPVRPGSPQFGEQVSWFTAKMLGRWYPRVCAWLTLEVERQPLGIYAGVQAAEGVLRFAIAREQEGAARG